MKESSLPGPQGLSLDNRCSCWSEGGTTRALTDFLRPTFIKENGKRKRRGKMKKRSWRMMGKRRGELEQDM